MVNTFALVILATIFLSGHAKVWNVEVKTFEGHKCDFSVWDEYDITPAYGHTCVRMYKTWTWWKAPYPWCYQNGGSWDYCNAYTWNVEYPEDRHMIKSQSRRKKYYFNYYQYATTYEDARKSCQSRGDGWDVADFQAVPWKTYGDSVKNIKEALLPLIETWDAFWVKNEDDEKQCLDFDSDRSDYTFKYASCDSKKTFVCEKDLD